MPTTVYSTTMRSARWCACLAVIALTAGCALFSSPSDDTDTKGPPIPDQGEAIPDGIQTVLSEGSVLTAHTGAGKITISAGPDSVRVFSWEDARRGVATKPRKQPFAGAMAPGLHYDGNPPMWPTYEGIDKVHYEESVRNFAAPIDAKIWTQIRRLYFTYNDHGLAVGWKRDGDTLHVEVWQFYVDGKRPEHLPGANDGAIKLTTKEQA